MCHLKKSLERLYDDKGEEAYQKIEKLISDYNKNKNKRKNKKSKNFLFSEKDVILVCYPDHVHEDGVKTLQTMHKFLNKYAKKLFNRIHFLPFFECSEIDQGFSIKNYYKVNELYGDWNDLKPIKKHFDFMFDLVLNHASIQNDISKKQIKGFKRYKDMFLILNKKINTSSIFRPRTSPLLTPIKTKRGKKYAWTTFSEDQVDWNYNNPKVLIEMIRIFLFYLSKGASAIRLDAVAYVWKKIGSSSFNLKESHIIVEIFTEVLKRTEPKAWTVAETVLPYEKNLKFLGNGHNESNCIYNFSLEPLLLHTFYNKDSRKATKFLDKMSDDFTKDTSILNLSTSHDGIHVGVAEGILNKKEVNTLVKQAEKKGAKILYKDNNKGKKKEVPYEINISYPSALPNIQEYLCSQSIQLAIKGIPLIYFNNLIGAENWNEGVDKYHNSRMINRQKFDYQQLRDEIRDKRSRKYKIYTGYKKLLKTRIHEPLFSPLADQKVHKINKNLLVIERKKDNKKLLAIHNINSRPIKIESEKIKKIMQKKRVRDILGKHRINLDHLISLKPYEVIWIK